MTLEPEFLELEDVLEFHEELLALHGGETGVRDLGLLESALAQPRAMFGGEYLHGDLFLMAAAFHLARKHPDANPVDQAFALLTYDGRDLGEMFVWPDAVEDWSLNLESDLGIRGTVVVYDWRKGTAAIATGTAAFEPFQDLYDFGYLVIAPVQSNGLALIGESARYVTLADRRFTAIAMDPDGFSVTLAGAPGEAVEVVAFDTMDGELLHAETVLGQDGTGSVRIGCEDAAR